MPTSRPSKKIYVVHPPAGDLPDGVYPASDLLEAGEADLAELAAATTPDDLATLIYTSGTTGPPKGVMITQYNIVYAIEMLKRSMASTFPDFAGLRTVSYLPMAHIAERDMSHYSGMGLGYDVYCCPDPAELTAYLKEVHPEILFGVPRVWEKINAGVNAALGADPERKAQFDDGVAAAAAIQAASFGRDRTDEEVATLQFLDDAAFANVRALVGLDALRVGVTGAAPIPNQVLEWYPRGGDQPHRDLRPVRDDRSADLVAGAEQDRLGRSGLSRIGDQDRRGRRSPVPRRQRVPGLPQPTRQDGRSDHRRLVPHRRHRRVGRRGLPAHRRSEEGVDHHRGRQEHQPGQPGGGVEDDPAHRPGGSDR